MGGCFMPNSGCHCGIAEGACLRDFPNATWSYLCHKCLETDFDDSDPEVTKEAEEQNVSDPEVTKAAEEKKDTLTVPAIIIATAIIASGCMVSLTVGVLWYRHANKRSNTDGAASVGTMVVGYPVDYSS